MCADLFSLICNSSPDSNPPRAEENNQNSHSRNRRRALSGDGPRLSQSPKRRSLRPSPCLCTFCACTKMPSTHHTEPYHGKKGPKKTPPRRAGRRRPHTRRHLARCSLPAAKCAAAELFADCRRLPTAHRPAGLHGLPPPPLISMIGDCFAGCAR